MLFSLQPPPRARTPINWFEVKGKEGERTVAEEAQRKACQRVSLGQLGCGAPLQEVLGRVDLLPLEGVLAV